eukprot:TCONS_00052865-protein
MPNLRSRKRTQEELTHQEKGTLEDGNTTNATMAKKMTVDEINQWVMIGPENLFINDEDLSLHKLPHPQNGVASLFAFKNKQVFELMKYKDTYRSWFINQTVQKDGSFCMLTPIDPLFLALPFIEKSSIKGQFTTLDNIMVDTDHTPGLRQLECCLTHNMLLNVCDTKGADDIIVYKSNQEKITKWLSQKITTMAKYLESSKINVKQGAQISGYNRSSEGQNNKESSLRYAWEMVSDYITEDRSLQLKENFGIKDPVKTVKTEEKLDPPQAKKQKLNNDPDANCLEDYRNKDAPKKKNTGTTKLSRAQKQLDKVDKKGMKTMSSFFAVKPKKK